MAGNWNGRRQMRRAIGGTVRAVCSSVAAARFEPSVFLECWACGGIVVIVALGSLDSLGGCFFGGNGSYRFAACGAFSHGPTTPALSFPRADGNLLLRLLRPRAAGLGLCVAAPDAGYDVPAAAV